MPSDFAWKLRLTAAMLGCNGRKGLCAAFRAANPATGFDLERAHKWLQGKALPRHAGVYADWAVVLGTDRSAAWLASCTRDAFMAELCRLSESTPEVLEARAAAFGGTAKSPVQHYLCGDFVAYSRAWAGSKAGLVIRGRFSVSASRGARFAVAYREEIPGGTLVMSGTADLAGRVLHVLVRDPSSNGPLFFSLLVPGRPAAMLCGMVAGATFASADPEPSATRIVLLRSEAGAAALDAGNRYIAPDEIAADLARIGSPADAAAVLRFLAHAPTQVGPAELDALAPQLVA